MNSCGRIGVVIFGITVRNGTERAVINFANTVAEMGEYTIDIIELLGSSAPSAYTLKREVGRINLGLNKATKTMFYSQMMIKMRRLLVENQYDYLVGTTHSINSVLALGLNRGRIIGWEHMNYDACPKLSRVIRKYAYKKLYKLVVLTKEDREKYLFLDSKKIYVVPNIISTTGGRGFSELRQRRIISIGRLTRQKGFDYLIDIAEIVHKSLPGWSFDIYGQGEDEPELRRKIKQKRLEGTVVIHKATSDIDIAYRSSSIFLLTSRWEGLPMVLLESQMYGIPAVSFDCPSGPSEIIENGRNGYLVPMGNITDAARKIMVLCNNYGLRIKMGIEAKKMSERYSAPTIYALWKKVLEE